MIVLYFSPQKRTDLQPARSSANTKSSAAATASTSKNKLPRLSKAPSTTEDTKPVVKSEPKEVKLETKEEPPKPKPSGKLDFSKAKPAPKPAPETRKIKVEPAESSTVSLKREPKPSTSKDKVAFLCLVRLLCVPNEAYVWVSSLRLRGSPP
jgi:DNA polymerase delta subunit 3